MSRTATLWGLLGLVAYALTRSLVYAKTKPLWVDELFTQVVCRQGNLSAIWRALSQGLDGQPPLFYLIERSAASLIPNENIGYRLLSVLGFVCTLILVYVFVRTRNGRAPALVCASLLLTTELFNYYAAEARPYSLWTACISIAMVCYQRTPGAPWVAGMFLSLLLASSLHYYAVFALFPFLLAEMLVVYHTREMRFKVWLALLAPLAPLGISLPLLVELKQRFGAHLYSQVRPHAFGTSYNGFFGFESSPWGTALAGAASVAMLASYFSIAPQPGDAKSSPAGYAAERVLVLGLIVSPVTGYAAAKIAHVSYLGRYFLPAILGIVAAVGYLLGRSKPMGIMLTATFLLFAIGTQERLFWKSVRHAAAPAERASSMASLAEALHHGDLPIVISDVRVYVEFWHYAPPGLRQRMVALVDPANAVAYTGTDTADQLLLALRSFAPVAVQDFAAFAAEHPVFLLYSNGSQFDWWPARLAHDGHRLQFLAVQERETMYLVELKLRPPN